MTTFKRFLTLFLITTLTVSVWAVPAYRGWQQRTLTDGTPVTVRQIGDEFYHFWETQDGKIALEQKDGSFVVTNKARPTSAQIKKRRMASKMYRSSAQKPRKTIGERNLAPKGLVILVQFSDASFKAANDATAFDNMLNQIGYSYGGATGSAVDYFRAQSNGSYVPSFDVFGPVTLSHNLVYYGEQDNGDDGVYGTEDDGENDLYIADFVIDAVLAADAAGCDFSQYDSDGDGYVDIVYFFYAGKGQAAGGTPETIWPHNWELQWALYNKQTHGTSGYYYNDTYPYAKNLPRLDGKYINNYVCSAELKSSGSRSGIGTLCHEFSHVLGMPDYYDTEYGDNDENGITPGEWSIMDQGSYNNDEMTPPNYSIFDKYYMGWATPKFLAVSAKANVTMTTGYSDAYQITGGSSLVDYNNTSTVYYIENRQKTGWDAYLPGSGMLVWKVKYSQSVWEDNEPNNSAGNPRYTIVPADGKTSNYGAASDVFPRTGVTSYTPFTGCELTNIAKSSSNITFKYNGGVSDTHWSYTLYGDHCTYPDDGTILKNTALNLTINPASGYTLADASCWEVTMGGSPLTYGTGFTYNTSTGAFSIASVTGDVEILVEGKRTVTWNVAGATNTTFFSEGAALVLPSPAPADCSGVGGKKFVGWTANSSIDGSAPADLFTAAGTKTVTANTTYYAVYATASGSGGSGSTITLDATTDTSFPKDGITLSVSGGTLTNGTDYRVYKNQTLTITSSVGDMTNIALTYSSASNDGGGWAASYTPNASSWTSPTASGEQARITQIVITVGSGGGGTSYSDYSLLCTTCSNTPTMSFTPATVNKTTSDATFTKVVSMSGNGPGQIAQYSSSDESVATVTNSGVVTLKGKVGSTTITAAVLASGDYCPASASYTLNVTAAPIDVTLYYNGTSANLTNQTNPYTLPTDAPYNTAMCSGDWTFAGWYGSSYAKSTDAPTYITQLTSTGSAYAVYTTTETSGGGSGSTITLDATTDTSFPKDGITLSVTDGTLTNGTDYRVYKNQTLTITSSVGDMTNIALTYSSASYDGGGWAASYTPNASSWTSPTASGEQARITQIVITVGGGGSSTTYYATTPECVTPCSNTPEMSFTPATVNKTTADATFTQAVTISGKGPGQTVLYSSSDETVATVDNSGVVTLKSKVGSTTITASVAADGDYCAASASYTLNVTAASYTVIWSMNGDESNFESYEAGEAIVFPGTATGCDGKVFRGWSAETVAETDVEPSYVTSATMPAHNVTYYAVYAEASGSGGTPSTLLSEDFSSITNGNSTSTTGSQSSWSGNTNIEHVSTAYQAGGAVRLGGGSSTGSIVTKALSATAGSTLTVAFDVKGWTTVEGNIRVTVTDCDPQVISYTSVMSGSFENKSAEFTLVSDNPTVTIATTAKRAFIDNIVITSGGGTTYSGYTTTCGAGISAQNIGWITSAQGKTVKRVINVSAKNFDDATTLTATCANSNFQLTLGESAVPAGTTGLTTTLTVEYTPTAESTVEANVDITLSAGDKTRTITVSGRSVPDDFLLITKKNDKWYALPANMTSGSGEYDGVEVSPNDATTPTAVPVSPSTLLYNLAPVASSRYAENGNLVRLVGNNNKCLWGNKATGDTKVNIQNYAALAESNGDNYEWDLKTTDGVHYFVESPCNDEYAEGRRLAYGTKFGMYKEETVFFIVRAGCSSQPGEIVVSPRRVDATFSWVSNTTQMHIDLYTNSEMTIGHLSATASSSPYVFTGLAESTDYWYKLTPGDDTDCAVTGTFKTTGPIIDIVEWQENGVVLFIDKGDINPKIVIDGQEEHGSITGGGNATELFFAKYFEGAGSMKLLSIFNGTKNDISLSNYKFYDRHAGSGATSYGADSEYDLSSLGSIKAGQEIIFFSRPLGTETDLLACSTDFLNSVATKNTADDNPRWIECASGKFANKAITINGNDAVLLKKNGTVIDVIGALNTPGQGSNCKSEDAWEGTIKNMDKGKSPSDPAFEAFFEASSLSPVSTADSIAILTAFGINLSDDEIEIPTARCIFFRDKRVQNGDSAVAMNTDDFVTFTNHTEGGTNYKAEWYGRSVCMSLTPANKAAAGVTNDGQATCNSYQDIANMDYNQYYIDWHNIDPGQELSTFSSDPETKEYTIPITDMRQYACLKLRFQLQTNDENHDVLTEASQQVPIVVTGSNVDTNDPLFSELVIDKVDPSDPSTWVPSYSHSLARCKDCDVVVLGSAALTKGPDSDEKDVPEVRNIKVYPGGQLIVPAGTNYTIQSLALRRQEDEIATANIQGTLTYKAPAAASPAPRHEVEADDAQRAKKTEPAPKQTYFDLRIDPTNWHYISLPYDVNVADIRFANPEETAIPALGTDYLLKWYNGEKRAATQAGGCWEMVAPDATLKKGLGYIFSLPGDGKVKREFRFPMSNDVITEDHSNKEVGIVYGYGCDKSMTEVRANHRGWNLIGNPFLMPYSSDITNPLLTGKIVEDHSTDPWDGHFMFEDNPLTNLHYIVEPVDNGWSEYRQVAIADYQMTPFTSYFVQIGGSAPTDPQAIQFKASRVQRSSIVSRRPAEYEDVEDTHPVWCAIDLTNSNAETDETTLLISDDFTDGYDIMNDLVKMRGTYYQYTQITTRPVLASRNNEGEMAFNALPDSSAVAGVPLNFFTAYTGSYTIAYNDKFDRYNEVKAVMLLDKTTNQWYDLMSEPYEFITNREDNTTRFILSVRVERKKPQTPTDLIDPSAGADGQTPRKLLINGHVYILRGGVIYDMTGKPMLNL